MMKKAVFTLKGMDCSACVINIDGALEETKGVKSVKTSYAKLQTEVEFDPKQTSEASIIMLLKQAGYTAAVK